MYMLLTKYKSDICVNGKQCPGSNTRRMVFPDVMDDGNASFGGDDESMGGDDVPVVCRGEIEVLVSALRGELDACMVGICDALDGD